MRRPWIVRLYDGLRRNCRTSRIAITPYLRRLVRLLALPYCHLFLIDWTECHRSRWQVAWDLVDIFFRLKTFPDFYGPCRLWERPRREWALYYGSNYDAYQRARLQREVQRPEYTILFEDKEVCTQLCRAAGLPMPETLGAIDPKEDYRARLSEHLGGPSPRRLFIKPVHGAMGAGMHIAERHGDCIRVRSAGETVILDDFSLRHRSIIQCPIEQDPRISEIYPSAVNTVRVVSMLTRTRSVLIVATSMRFGVGDNFVDNWSAGGVAVGVDKRTGKLSEVAFKKTGRRFKSHPTTGFVFKGFQLPRWKELLELAERVQSSLPYHRLIGMDIALSTDGPLLVEINACPDLVFQEQTSGPLLADAQVRDAFAQYDLLISK